VPDEDALRAGGQNSFRAMGDELVARLQGMPTKLDLIVIAHTTPDFEPIVSAALHLAHVCPGEARAFALSDHGIGAPFAALQVIAAHLAVPEYRHALLVVVDQTTLPTYDARVHARPVEDSAVAIVLGRGEACQVTALSRHQAGPVEARRQLARLAASQSTGTMMLVGPSLASAAGELPLQVHIASPRNLCTAVWIALSERLGDWSGAYERLVIADYDTVLEHLHCATLELAAQEIR
jgi:hypothetical protein